MALYFGRQNLVSAGIVVLCRILPGFVFRLYDNQTHLIFWQNRLYCLLIRLTFCSKWRNQFFSKKVLLFSFWCAIIYKLSETAKKNFKYPGVAKFGIALEWGSRGRRFESSHSDQVKSLETVRFQGFFFFTQKPC